jgi:hypothetical protein
VFVVLFMFGLVGRNAVAQPEPWAHPDGTIHYYHAVAQSTGLTWYSAFDSAQIPGGYLATITTQTEDDFVFGLVDSSPYWYERPGSGSLAGPWLGGFQPAGSTEPNLGWSWITNEPFGFDDWSAGQPDNSGRENALHFGESAGIRVPTWDDADGTDGFVRGYVREMSADSTSLGLLPGDSGAFVGYTLFAPHRSRTTYLIDNEGRLVHSWTSAYEPAFSAYLLEDGSLLRTANVHNPDFGGGGGGRVERFDWAGNLAWFYDYSSTAVCQHHDIEPLPDGNVLLVAWELKTRDEAIAAGRDSARITANKLWPDHVVEVDPTNDSIVWEWHVWDHLIQDYDSTKQNYGAVADHPELVDLNYTGAGSAGGRADWNHANAVGYNPEFDQIVISVLTQDEVWVIDHSTTTEEARGHSGGRQGMGGDILYRWGNPQVYRAGSSADRKFFGQHDARWIEPGLTGGGHMMVFNNGVNRPDGQYSTVDEFIPTSDNTGRYPRPAPGMPHGPAQQCWVYKASPPTSFLSESFGGANRLPNGNTLICEATSGRFFEVMPDTSVVWRYVNPMIDSVALHQGDTVPGSANAAFRAPRYASDYPGLAGRDLTPGYPIERYASPSLSIASPDSAHHCPGASLSASPCPSRGRVVIGYRTPVEGHVRVSVYSLLGAETRTLVDGCRPAGHQVIIWDGTTDSGNRIGPGVYVCRLSSPGGCATEKVLLTQ